MKQNLMRALRAMHVIEAVDAARYFVLSRGKRSPGPPAHLVYDACGTLDWDSYWSGGHKAAGYIATFLKTGRILEFGCGPGRIIRHMPGLIPKASFYGSDYNRESIAWCAAEIKGVKFTANELAPPLPFGDGHFDSIYAISVFTHLSEAMHHAWARELHRVLKPGGVLLCTLHGDASREWLMDDERATYDAGWLVVRGNVPEGKRLFLAYHPEAFVRSLFQMEVVAHVQSPGEFRSQDVWVFRKPQALSV